MEPWEAPEGNIFTSHGGSLLDMRVVSPTDALHKGFFGSSSKLDYDPNKFLYIQTTIVPSTRVEANGYHIKPGHEFSNTWSDSIDEQVLDYFAPTFGISHIYLEHVHIPALRKGRVVDHHLYRQDIGPTKNVLIADGLLALETKHADLVKMVLDRDIYAVSQGCFSDYLRCSRCGKVAARLEDACDHVKSEGNTFFTDKQGTRRLVTNLLGDPGRDTSFAFFDVSLVLRPAFFMAVFQNILNHNLDDLREKSLNSSSLLSSFFDLFTSSQAGADASRMPMDRDGEIPVEKLFLAYDGARGARNPYAAYSKALYAQFGEQFVSSDVKYLNLVNFLSSYREIARGVQIMKLSDKVRDAHKAAKSYLSSTQGATPEMRDQFVATLLKLPQDKFQAECARYTSAEAIGDEKAPKADYASGAGKTPEGKAPETSKETSAALTGAAQAHKAGKIMSADGKVPDSKSSGEAKAIPDITASKSGAQLSKSDDGSTATGVRGSDDKKADEAKSAAKPEEKKADEAKSAAKPEEKKDEEKGEKSKSAEAIGDDVAETQTAETIGGESDEPTFDLDTAMAAGFGSAEGDPEEGAPEEGYEITVDVDPDKQAEALAEFESWLAENASDPATPSEEDLSNAIAHVEKKYGPGVIAAALLKADEVAEETPEVEGEGEETPAEGEGEGEGEETPAEGESAESIGDEKANTQAQSELQGEEIPAQADAPAVHLGDETQNARGGAAPAMSGDQDAFMAGAESMQMDDYFGSAEELLSAFGVLGEPAAAAAARPAPKAVASAKPAPHTSSAKPAVVAAPRKGIRLPMLSARKPAAGAPTGDMLFESAFGADAD